MGDEGWIESPKELEDGTNVGSRDEFFSPLPPTRHNEAETFILGGSDNLIFNDSFQVRLQKRAPNFHHMANLTNHCIMEVAFRVSIEKHCITSWGFVDLPCLLR